MFIIEHELKMNSILRNEPRFNKFCNKYIYSNANKINLYTFFLSSAAEYHNLILLNVCQTTHSAWMNIFFLNASSSCLYS